MIESSYKPIQSESPPRSPDLTPSQASAHRGLLQRIQAIDRSFIVLKLFYFFFYTALGALFPFFSLYYKQLWLSPLQIGILLALRPTVKLICLPLWKMITDKYSKPKAVYFISLFGWLIGYYGQTLILNTDFHCYLLKPTQVFTPTLNSIPSTNSSNLSMLLDGSIKLNKSKREWSLEEIKMKFQPKPYLEEKRIPGSLYWKTAFKRDDDSFQYKKKKSKKAGVVESSRRFHLNEQATPNNDMHSENIIQQSNTEEDKSKDDSGKGKNLSKKDDENDKKSFQEKSDRVSHDANLVKQTLSKSKKSKENAEKEFAGLEKKRENKKESLDDLDIEEEADSPGQSLAAHVTGYPRLKVGPSGPQEKHLGAFQHGEISKSPKPREDFRVKYNYWILRTLIVIVILTEIITSPTPMLADSAVIQSLAGTQSDYGKQRLFGSLGLALAAILVALWVSYSSFCLYTDTINYLPCFYIFLIAIGATVFVSLLFDFPTPKNNGYDPKLLETLKIFKSPRYGFFLFTIFFTGFAHSLQISFLFWFLQDMGGTPTLFAVIILVHCVSEVVMYFLAGYINQAVGHQGTICIALACYTARFLMYGSLESPWLIIPMEMVQSMTYGGLWSVATVYIRAPEESTKMIQSILHGAYWGVGMATGALVSGVVIEVYGAKNEFLVMSLLMFILCVVHIFVFISDRIQELDEEVERKRDSGSDKLKAGKKGPENFIGAAAAPLVPCLLYGR